MTLILTTRTNSMPDVFFHDTPNAFYYKGKQIKTRFVPKLALSVTYQEATT